MGVPRPMTRATHSDGMCHIIKPDSTIIRIIKVEGDIETSSIVRLAISLNYTCPNGYG